MRRTIARSLFWLLLAALGGATACGDDDDSAPPSGTSGNAGRSSGGDNGASGDGVGEGGVASTEGGTASAGTASASAGAAGTGVGGSGNDADVAGMPGLGGAGSPAQGGSGPDMPGPPDLLTSSGGPWPDSLTGSCANTIKIITCPQQADDFFGQDGTYRINVPSYSASATAMTDKVTGLIWQLVPDQTQKTQADAVTYCDALDLGGHNDWRLPTRLEYVSVLDEGMGSGSAMPPAIPLDTQGAQWTASATGTTAGAFFLMDDTLGTWTVGTGSSPHGARCVRGTPLSGSLAVDTDVVTDGMTNLVWQTTNLVDTFVTWQEALAHCEGLTHATKDDWRLPSIKELATIVDETASQAPVISTDFGDGMALDYWSSTPAPNFGPERFALALDTDFGASPSLKMSEAAAAARCVRTAD
jgi:hypothetical protein